VGEVRVGTCSWTDPTLIEDESFYPKKTMTAEKRLKFYAERFDVVEVDSTFYALPSEKVISLQTSRTPDNFTLNYKAFGLLTQHSVNPKAFPKAVKMLVEPSLLEQRYLPFRLATKDVLDLSFQMFSSALRPAQWSNELGAVLFQFPPTFSFSKENMDYMLTCKEKLFDYRLAIEFRHPSWLSEENKGQTMNFLKNNNLAYVSVDEPQYESGATIPPIAEATADIGYVRFHGRNTGTWFRKGTSTAERFSYLYSEDELIEWAKKMRQIIYEADRTYVMFNNCYRNYGITNAQMMKKILSSI